MEEMRLRTRVWGQAPKPSSFAEKCPLNPIDASTYPQIRCMIRMTFLFPKTVRGKKPRFPPPQRFYRSFRQERFELDPQLSRKFEDCFFDCETDYLMGFRGDMKKLINIFIHNFRVVFFFQISEFDFDPFLYPKTKRMVQKHTPS